MNKKVLVTGGAGYIGSHTCKLLSQSGFEPIVYDNLSRGNEWAVKWGPLEIGDILDTENLSRVIKKYEPIAVMHFAAFAYVGESVTNPMIYYKNNVAGTISILEAMIENDLRKFIFSSTCATYGDPKEIPITETHPQNPINPYGRSKLMIERILKDYSDAGEIDYVSLRYFNAAGADLDTEIGENHDPEPHLIPLILFNALGKRKNIKIFGTDYPTPDGTCIRDYIHILDLGSAHLKAMNYLLDDGKSIALNLGNKKGYSIKEVIDAVEKVTEKKITVVEDERREGDPSELVGDYSLAQSTIGWSPEYSMDEIIESAWNWHKKDN